MNGYPKVVFIPMGPGSALPLVVMSREEHDQLIAEVEETNRKGRILALVAGGLLAVAIALLVWWF